MERRQACVELANEFEAQGMHHRVAQAFAWGAHCDAAVARVVAGAEVAVEAVAMQPVLAEHLRKAQ